MQNEQKRNVAFVSITSPFASEKKTVHGREGYVFNTSLGGSY